MHCDNGKQRSVILGENQPCKTEPGHATRMGNWYFSAMSIVSAELFFT